MQYLLNVSLRTFVLKSPFVWSTFFCFADTLTAAPGFNFPNPKLNKTEYLFLIIRAKDSG